MSTTNQKAICDIIQVIKKYDFTFREAQDILYNTVKALMAKNIKF